MDDPLLGIGCDSEQVGASAAMNHNHRPWQLDWKRPRFSRTKNPSADPAAGTAQEEGEKEKEELEVVHHAAAAVSVTEVQDILKSISSGKEPVTEDDTTSRKSSSMSYVISVTLLSSTSLVSEIDPDGSPAADKLRIELLAMRQQQGQLRSGEEQEGDTIVCLESRLLQWPASALRKQRQTKKNAVSASNTSEKTLDDDENLSFSSTPPSSSPTGHPRRLREKQLHDDGLVAVAFCRRSTTNQAATTEQHQIQDALDLLQLMSLGREEPPGPLLSRDDAEQHQDGIDTPSNEGGSTAEGDEEELLLACLGSAGEVYFYSPLTLLRKSQEEENCNTSDGKEHRDIFARFLFGDDVFRVVQDRMVPLSEPLYETLLLPIHHHRSVAWDPAFDSQTLIYQTTKNNRPTHIVAAGDFVCIAGEGKRQPHRRRSGILPAVSEHGGNNSYRSLTKRMAGEPGVSSDARNEETESDHRNTTNPAPHEVTPDEDGGFVCLYYQYNFALARFLYLPFAPRQVALTSMHGRNFLVIVGEINRKCQVVAVCLDVAMYRLRERQRTQLHKIGGMPGTFGAANTNKEEDDDAYCYCRRFQIIPILLPTLSEDFNVIISSQPSNKFTDSLWSPELVVLVKQQEQLVVMQRTIRAMERVPRQELIDSHQALAAHLPSEGIEDTIMTIITGHTTSHTARIPLLAMETESFEKFGGGGDGQLRLFNDSFNWCYVAKGFCVLGFAVSQRCLLICWEGATGAHGAFVHELIGLPSSSVREDNRTPMTFYAPILTIPIKSTPGANHQLDFPALPFMGPSRRSETFRGFNEQRDRIRRSYNSYDDNALRDDTAFLDGIVLEALRSISSQNYRDTILSASPPLSPRFRSSTYTPSEKSERLLRQCSSWTQLETSDDSYAYFGLQVPVLAVRFSDSCHWVLSLRKVVVDNGVATPFQQVLSWMSKQKDYFAAASLALDLLGDAESLRFLWRSFEKIDDDDERAKLEGLLDGILPIHGKDVEEATLTHLADMTVGCLTKGGFAMAPTLEHFLEVDRHYDVSRACLMLVATAANAVSDDEHDVLEIMGEGYKRDDRHDDNLLWPVRCLLKAAVARDSLIVALLLLNSAIPDEVRHRRRCGIAATSMPSLQLCMSLVTLIVASAPDAAGLLLDLVDEQSRQPFWESLSHETQLELSLLQIRDKAPMLRQREVRDWTVVQLQKQITAEGTIEAGSSFLDILPTQWLKRLSMACIANAECLVKAVSKSTSENYLETLQSTFDLVASHGTKIYRARNALTPAPGSGGLDFDLFIPALLILKRRDVAWSDESSASTQSILNAACFLAGRSTIEEPMFPLDSATLMRLCTLINNVQAGANLVGGSNALILECCDILMRRSGLTMEQAEEFLLSEPMLVNILGPANSSETFSLQDDHVHVLWLLDEHVLAGVRTYGDLETSSNIRGKVDPIFAAKMCLRTWWFITRKHTKETTKCLTEWLEESLNMTAGSTSPRRLACAALARALVWPAKATDRAETILAARLEMPKSFLVSLTRSCCGLVESLPPHEAERAWANTRMDREGSSVATNDSETENTKWDSIDDSFVSAAGSMLDLET